MAPAPAPAAGSGECELPILRFLLVLLIVLTPGSLAELKAEVVSGYELVDADALAVRITASTTPSELAAHLTAHLGSDAQKARAIYRWITANVDYDIAALAQGDLRTQQPQVVLRTGRAVCHGYALLFNALAAEAGLESRLIRGFSKGVGDLAGGRPAVKPDHAWNAVLVDGQWRLVDATWGAGYLSDGRFVRRFSEHYFLTSPAQFVYDHFPEDSKWQLLDKPLSRQQYESLVALRPAFFDSGLQVVSHPAARIQVAGMASVRLRVPQDSSVLARLETAGGKLPASTLAQREGEHLVVHVAPPAPGEYLLRIYAAKGANPSGEHELAAEYKVISSGGAQAWEFPTTFGAFGETGATVSEPLSRVLQAGSQVRFRIAVPGASDVAVVQDGKWQSLKNRAGTAEGLVSVQTGQVQVAARMPGRSAYDVLLAYDVR